MAQMPCSTGSNWRWLPDLRNYRGFLRASRKSSTTTSEYAATKIGCNHGGSTNSICRRLQGKTESVTVRQITWRRDAENCFVDGSHGRVRAGGFLRRLEPAACGGLP